MVAIDASLPALTTGTGASVTTASFSPPANTLLAVYFAANNPSPGADCSLSGVTSSPSLTWTRGPRKCANAASTGGAGTAGDAEIWTAPYVAGGAITVTATSIDATTGAGHEKALQVVPYTGADTASLTNFAAASSTSGLPSVTLPGCSAGSLPGAVSSDWAQAGLGTAGTGQTIISESNTAGQMTMHFWRTTTTLASSGSQTMNLTAPAAEQYNLSAIEIKDSGGGGGAVAVPTRLQVRPGKTWLQHFRRQTQHNVPQYPSVTGPQAYTQTFDATLGFTGDHFIQTSKLLVATLAFTTALTRRLPNQLFTAALSLTGSLVSFAVHHFTQALTATLGFTGTQARSVSSHLASQLSFTTARFQLVQTKVVATISFTTTSLHRVIRTFTGAVGFTGLLARAFPRVFTSTLGFTGTQTRRVGSGQSAALSFTGLITRRISVLRTATLSFTTIFSTGGAIHYQQAFSAALSFTGTQVRSIRKLQASSLSFTGAEFASIRRTLTASLSFTTNFATASVRHFTQAFTATLGFTTSLTRIRGIILLSTIGFTTAQHLRIAHNEVATLGFTTAQFRRSTSHLSGSIGFTGNVFKRTAHAFVATLSFTGFVSTQRIITRAFTASVGFSVQYYRSIRPTFTASLSFVSTIKRGMRVNLRSTVGFIGNLILSPHILSALSNFRIRLKGREPNEVLGGRTSAGDVQLGQEPNQGLTGEEDGT